MIDFDWPEIFFIRHGQTAWNAEFRYQGQRDIPLNALGQRQADANGPLLRALLARRGLDPAAMQWFASPLGRATETMARVRAAFDGSLPEVIEEPRLTEISFGVMEGLLVDEIMAEAPTMTVAGRRNAEYWSFRPEEGESYEDVVERIAAFRVEMTRPSVIVAHGGIARVFRFLIERAPVVELVNWPAPQDAVLHFLDGRMDEHYAAADTGLKDA